MNKGILSVKILILGTTLFLAGLLGDFGYNWRIRISYEDVKLVLVAVGSTMLLLGLLMGNEKEKTKDDKDESN